MVFIQRTNVITASGDYIVVSGTVHAIIDSGISVTISGVQVDVSGQPVQISGQSVTVSGQPVKAFPLTAVRPRPILRVSDLSGGVNLVSGTVTQVLIKSLDGEIYVGGTSGIDMPYIGYGILMEQYDSLVLPIQNFNLLNVCAGASGNRITYGGVGY